MPLTGDREMVTMLDSFAGFVRLALVIGLTAISVAAQTAAVLPTQAPGISGTTAQASSGPPPRLAPTYANIEYAPPDPPTSNGHKLDLYIPSDATRPLPVVIWTGGSAWFADTGKNSAGRLAAQLEPAGYAVAGVSIRSSSQVKFPGQLQDIKAAIRWMRANAAKYGLDPNHIAIMGDSSGGWTAAMAAMTGDAPEMEGSIGTTGFSSAVQAAVAFYPPTNFLTMDAWALRKCSPKDCHDSESSPESQLLGCAIQTCPEKAKAASPMTYITPADPPIMILHGGSDQLVPHNQGEQLYMALNKACKEAIFISLPKAPHGNSNGFLTNDALREAATMRSTSSAGCTVVNPTPYTPTWKTVIDFLDKYMK
jgi:acetyl esterase/lipase